MAKSTTLEKTKHRKQEISINTFAGIDRSTSRYRIEGNGERFYEASNVFPYVQGLLQRRRDAVQTNSRASDAAFPSFPSQTLTGDPVISQIVEFNDNILILFEDDGDKGKVLIERFDVGANTLTTLIDIADAVQMDNDGELQGVPYNHTGAENMVVTRNSYQAFQYDNSWTRTSFDNSVTDLIGVCDVYLQTMFAVSSSFNKIRRTDVDGSTWTVEYDQTDSVGRITRLLSFGYQTSSAGATTILLVFKPTSISALTGIGTQEVFEQITGNIGLAGKWAVSYTPFGVCFVGRDTDGLLNLYLLDRTSLVLHTIGHELYEELNDIPKENYDDIILSFHRNRMIRISMTKTGDSVTNNREYWVDFYNGLKKRTVWGPFLYPASNTLLRTISFSGGNTPENSGFFMLLKEGSTYKIYEDVNTDTYDSTDTEWDDQIYRTKMYDFGGYYGLISKITLLAKANGAKFKVYMEKPKTDGDDDDTTQTLIATEQMGTSGGYESQRIRIVPPELVRQFGFKIESDYDATDNNPFELSQFTFEYQVTGREIIE